MLYDKATPQPTIGGFGGIISPSLNSVEITNLPKKIKYIPILSKLYSDLPFRNKVRDSQDRPFINLTTEILNSINNLLKNYKQIILDYEEENNTIYPEDEKDKHCPAKMLNRYLKEYSSMDFFNQYSFKEINTNTLKRMSDNEYKIPLLKNNLEITLDNLSTGEKVIMYLILSKCLAIFNDIELLLIDELDAHLNPALLKIYYDILTQISTTIPVIVTTHNPVFVNLVSNENLFWMENGRVLPKTKQTKYKILNKLASGLFTVNDIIENIIFYIFFNKKIP